MRETENKEPKYGHGQIIRSRLSGAFTCDKPPPSFMAFMNNLCRILLIFGLTREGKLVLGLPIRNLVDPEPLIRGPDQTR